MIEIAYTLQDGKERIGRLVHDNNRTALIYPYRWIKCSPIKVHKIKNRVRVLKNGK